MSSADLPHRSYLFAPASSADVMRKALSSSADAVVLDLEDSVAPEQKASARSELRALLDELASEVRADAAPEIHVRINAAPDGQAADDVRVAVHPLVSAIRLPKVETAEQVHAASAAVREQELQHDIDVGSLGLYPTIESAQGVMGAERIAAADLRVRRLVLGHADLIADLGAHGDDALTTLVPGALVALASRAAGIGAPVDGATTDLSDATLLDEAARVARALGYSGKSAIHPRQLDAIHRAFAPSDAEIAHATRIVRAAQEADGGATSLDGQLIDIAIVRRAQRLLHLRRER